MTHYNPEQSFCVRDDLVIEQVDDQALVLDMSRNVYFSLNPMAVMMFDGLKRGLPLSGICDEIMDVYDVTPELVQDDLVAFVASLIERNLLSVAP